MFIAWEFPRSVDIKATFHVTLDGVSFEACSAVQDALSCNYTNSSRMKHQVLWTALRNAVQAWITILRYSICCVRDYTVCAMASQHWRLALGSYSFVSLASINLLSLPQCLSAWWQCCGSLYNQLWDTFARLAQRRSFPMHRTRMATLKLRMVSMSTMFIDLL